jgi:transcriptional regulator GlxA family with amidase domain
VANFSFHPDFLESVARSLKADVQVLYQRPARKIILDDSLESLFSLLMGEVEQDCKSGSAFLEHVSRALAIAIVQYLAGPTAKSKTPLDPRIERAFRYIEEHFQTKITLDDIGEVASLSRFHLLRMFRASLVLHRTNI